MAILQALLALITKSAGKILNAIFGWAVHALFGQTSSREQTFLSALVAAAVAWPLLVVGLIAPKIAALLLAFVPIPAAVPSWAVRLVWLALVLVVPLALGMAIATRAPPSAPREPVIKRLARGFPITIGLAAAFLIMFVSVPLMRMAALVRRQRSADVPLATQADAYHQVAGLVVEVLNGNGFRLRPARPGWWVRAPTRILAWFGGNAFRRFVPERLEHHESPELVVSFYTSGVLVRGARQKVTWAQGLIAETVPRCDGFETIDSATQKIEKQIRRLWQVYELEPSAHRNSRRLLDRLAEITREMGELDVEFDQWQVLYRQLLQLHRAIRDEGQLLESSKSRSEEVSVMLEDKQADEAMTTSPSASAIPRGEAAAAVASSGQRSAAALSTGELVKELTAQVGLLAKKQIDLAKTELQADLRAEAAAVGGLGIAALAGIVTINLLMVTAVLALAQKLPAWTAGLLMSGFTLGIAGLAALVGWSKRVRNPLARTRRTLKDDAQWTKERLA